MKGNVSVIFERFPLLHYKLQLNIIIKISTNI